MESSSVNNLLEDNLNESIKIPKSSSQLCVIAQHDVIFTNQNANNNISNPVNLQSDNMKRNRTSSFTLGVRQYNYPNTKLNYTINNNTINQLENKIRPNKSKQSAITTTPINILAQRHLVMEMLQESSSAPTTNQLSLSEYGGSKLTISSEYDSKMSSSRNYGRKRNRQIANDNLSTILSTFYAKFIIVLGIAFPVTDILSIKAPPSFYQGFYLYLYLVSVTFVIFIFVIHLRQRRIIKLESYRNKFNINSNTINEKDEKYLEDQGTRRSSGISITKQVTTHSTNLQTSKIITNNCNNKSLEQQETNVRHYGSFYLRIGAVAFGIGSMVYSGLEFGQYFELKEEERCQNALIILNPVARMLLTIVQMQFIYLNTKDLGLYKNKIISRFGLMHMIATNICEWLYVLVEETKHEIINIAHKDIDSILYNNSNNNISILNEYNRNNNIQNHQHTIMKRATSLEIVVECRRTNIMGLLVQNASPFLFPCTIEYSLICAVTLFEMWKRIIEKNHNQNTNSKLQFNKKSKLLNNINLNKNYHKLSVDCTKAQKGLFFGILVIVLTIISLVIYFEMSHDLYYQTTGIFGIIIAESLLYIFGIIGSFGAIYQMRDLRYLNKQYNNYKISFDCQLLIVTQSGIFIYSMFSIIGSYFLLDIDTNGLIGLITELLSLIQTSIQTLFILNVWWRRCQSSQEIRKKPGKDIVTFLLITNMALWMINSLIKSRAVFRPNHLIFFGQWAWTIITHISIPLAIFYRLHSTICLFEIWKKTFKNKY